MTKSNSQERRRSIRLPGYDYAQPGGYAVTICTQDAAQLFGEVMDGEVQLSPYGRVVQDCWQEIPAHSPHVALDAFVVMPNHVHGIIVIMERNRRGEACLAPTTRRLRGAAPGSLPQIVGSFKSAATRRINQLRGTPGGRVWQRGYYEHVVRDERELDKLRRYVLNNPLKWELDRENPDRIEIKRRE